MTRLDGEKKSPLPWIIGLIVLALLAAAIYYFAVANKGADQAVINQNGVELQNTAPGGLGIDNSADANMADANAVDANTADANMMDANAATGNMSDANAMDSGAMGSNSMDSNAADMNAMDSNAMDTNSMDSNAMDANSAMSNGTDMGGVAANSADGNSQSMSGVPVPGATPASANSKDKAGKDTIATRSKTIKTGDKTVIYQKSVKADGSLVQNKTIVPKPVVEAKKQ